MTASAGDPHVGLVVEGAGDLGAVPVVLRMHLQQQGEYRDILGKPVPLHGKGNASAIQGYVATAGYRPGCVGVLVVLDCDDDCPAELGPALLAEAAPAVGVPVLVALADRDFEDWLYASAETLDLGLEYEATSRGKGAIEGSLKPRKYVKPTWQPRLAHRLDLALAASRSASLARMLHRFDDLRSAVPGQS